MRPSIAAVVLFLFSLPAVAAPPLVRNPRPLPKYGNEYPLEIYVGNFGGDSANDVLSVVGGHSIQVIVNEADGITGPAVVSPIVETSIKSAATGDLDGDGDLDVAVSIWESQQIVTYLSNGGGTFTRDAIISGQRAGDVGIADFNRDGDADLALAREVPYGYGEILVFAGNGAGVFAAPITTALSSEPSVVRVVDANGDGKPDLLMAGWNSLSIALGHGDGTFVVSSIGGPHGFQPTYDLATGDFNGDTVMDFALTANSYLDEGFVAVYRGLGNGTFALAGQHYGMEYFVVTVADVDADGRQDLVGGSYAGNFAVLRGNGDATFQAPELWHTGHIWDIVAGDFTRDGHADVVMFGGAASTSLQMVAGTGDGEFATYRAFLPGGVRPYSAWYYAHAGQIRAADMNNDGAPDLVSVLTPKRFEAQEISVLLNAKDGRGTMLSPLIIPTPHDNLAIAVGDVNGDGKRDIVATPAYSSYSIQPGRTYLGRGDGTFEPPKEFSAQTGGPALVDLTGDGVVDLVVGGWVHRGFNDGTFSALAQLNFPAHAFGDVNGDGRIDFVGHGLRDTIVAINNGDGTSFTTTQLPDGDYAGIGTLSDIDGDGALDILMLGWSNTVFTRFGKGDGTFGEPLFFSLLPGVLPPGERSGVTTGDFDGDGELDLAAGAVLYLGHGDGTFDGYAQVQVHGTRESVAADLDGNGTDDLALLAGDAAISIIRTNLGPDSTLTATVGLTTTPNPSMYAASITSLATLAGGAIPPTGAVVFAADGKPFAMRTVAQLNQAAYTALALGTHVITATYTGDDRYAPASAAVQQVVQQAATTVDAREMSSSSHPCGTEVVVYGVVRAPTAYGLPGPGPITWREGGQELSVRPAPDWGPGYFSLSGLRVGLRTIAADFPGDANYAASSKTFTVQINPSINATITAGGAVFAGGTGFASARTYDGATYAWTIGNGTIDSGQGTPRISYTAGPSGSVTLGLTITRTWCGGTATHTTTIIVQEPGATMFHLLQPCRVVDTRFGEPLTGGATRELPLANACGIPADAKTLAVNLTVVSPASTGWLALYAADTGWPGTSTLNYRTGRTRANGAIVPVSPGARLKVRNDGPDVHFVIDVLGFFR